MNLVNFLLHIAKVKLYTMLRVKVPRMQHYCRGMPRKVLHDSKKGSAFPFVHMGGWKVAYARAEVIARDSQANAGYAPHSSQHHVCENVCTKN